MITANEIAFWAFIVISNVWSASGRSVLVAGLALALAILIRAPHWIKSLKAKP